MKRFLILFMGLVVVLMAASSVDAKTRKKSKKTKTSSINIYVPSYNVFCEAFNNIDQPEKLKALGLSVLYRYSKLAVEEGMPNQYDICVGKGVEVINHGNYDEKGFRVEYKATNPHAFFYSEGRQGMIYRTYCFKNRKDRDTFFCQMLLDESFEVFNLYTDDDGWYVIQIEP